MMEKEFEFSLIEHPLTLKVVLNRMIRSKKLAPKQAEEIHLNWRKRRQNISFGLVTKGFPGP
jgi:hypothetical protein